MTNNDTSTLNGALQELGETMAANLTTMGVPSTYDEGLTTLAGKILNISPGPIPASISLTADKSILSYADSQSATLSATVLDEDSQAIEGVSVEFFNGSTSMGTATTNSSGVATKTYASAGAGDISFTAEVGSLVSEIFTVEDCIKTFMNTYSSQVPLNYSLPSNYKIEFILNSSSYSTSSGSRENVCYIRFDSSSGVYIGKGSSSNRNIIINNPYGVLPTGLPVSTDTKYTFIKNNGTVSLTDGTDTISGSSNVFTKLDHVKGSSDGVVKNIKIKPL